MSIKAVLFDLDGTLLPMDQDDFIKAYLGGLAKKMAPYGYDPEVMVKAVYLGMKAMTSNDGVRTNEETFWDAFTSVLGEKVKEDIPIFDDFYKNEFQEVKNICGFLPESAQTVHKLKEMGYRVVLATTPMFPSIATESRIRWAGMEPTDFEIFTTYEHYHYCKPSLNYYREILEKTGLAPEECLMVGNDVGEDMVAKELGMKVFLMPADLINKVGKDTVVYPQGNLKDLMAYIATL